MIGIGVLTPHRTAGPEIEFVTMAGSRVTARVARVYDDDAPPDQDPTTPAALRRLAQSPYVDRAVRTLPAEGVDVIGHASTTTAYVIGAAAEQALLARVAELTGRPVCGTASATGEALRALGVSRVALVGAPWFSEESNQLGREYFTSAGFEVVPSRSAALVPDPERIDSAALVEWTVSHLDDAAEAIVFGGNGFRVADAIEALEAAVDRPVLTANQSLLWQLLAQAPGTEDQVGITGHGRLFERSGGRR